VKLKFQWKAKTGQYQTGDECFLGKIKVGEYNWNGSRSQGSTDPSYVASSTLPQLSKRLYDNDTDMLKQRLEAMISAWFKEAL
jgi:hypothetical protein